MPNTPVNIIDADFQSRRLIAFFTSASSEYCIGLNSLCATSHVTFASGVRE
jgi:hypothetical protein